MATSGTSSFTATRNEIIRQAAFMVNALPLGGSLGSHIVDIFNHRLNAMVKHWQGKGIHVWTVTEGTLFPQPGTVQYALSDAATSAHATQSYSSTTISADEASGQATLSVSSTANMTVADKIGVVLDDGTLHWSTISSKTSSTVTIADALTDSAAEGNSVFNYTSRIVRPLKVVAARTYDVDSGNETPLTMMSRQEYRDLPNKTQTGAINQFFYDPQLSAGQLYIWQAITTANALVNFTWHRPIQDFTASGDNPDLPQEWINCLEWNLALEMTATYPVPDARYVRISTRAAQLLDDLTDFDREEGSVYFGLDMEG